MKLTIKFATAALLAISAVAPALASEPEAALLAERNTYVYANAPVAKPAHAQTMTDRAMGSFAQAPAQQSNVAGYDAGIGSQS
jgi:hypothetical protein